jgi:hypothetical protein
MFLVGIVTRDAQWQWLLKPTLISVRSDECNRSQFSSGLDLLGCAEAAPLDESGGTVQLEI